MVLHAPAFGLSAPGLFTSPRQSTTAFVSAREFCDAATLRIASFAPPTKKRKPARRLVSASGSIPERIAVVGGGLAGLATTFHLLHSTDRVARKREADSTRIKVSVFDTAETPGTSDGASAVTAGLLHPFTPRSKKLAWEAEKGMAAAHRLIEVAQEHASQPLMKEPGLIRFGMNEKQEQDLAQAHRRFPRAYELLSAAQLEDVLSDPPVDVSGILCKRSAVVDTRAYLQALWTACQATGRATWLRSRVDRFEDLFEDHDAVVLCAGAATVAISNMAALPILPCRGQHIRFTPRLSETSRGSDCPVISGKYIIPDLFSEGTSVIGGATFEYCEEGTECPLEFARGVKPPDMQYALSQLSEPLYHLSPMLLDQWIPEEAFSGVRALPPRSTIGSIPIAAEVKGCPEGKSAWVLTGLGSRGLLHHAFLGRVLARAVVAECDLQIPGLARRIALGYETLAGAHNPDEAHRSPDRPRPKSSNPEICEDNPQYAQV